MTVVGSPAGAPRRRHGARSRPQNGRFRGIQPRRLDARRTHSISAAPDHPRSVVQPRAGSPLEIQSTMLSVTATVRETRLRRMLVRQGYWLAKIGRRDLRARDYGQYKIVDEAGTAVAGWPARSFNMDAMERWAEGEREGE